MADIKSKFPVTSTTALTITLASLANDSTNVRAGRESTAVDNTTFLDLDHVLTGKITTGTSPTLGNRIEIWVYAPVSVSSGTPTYPVLGSANGVDGSDGLLTAVSRNVLFSAMRMATTIVVDATSNQEYPIAGISISSVLGYMPMFWGVFVINAAGSDLNPTAGNHALHYLRVQAQTV